MADPSENISIEDLTEIYRVENKSGAISLVRKDFYPAVAIFMKNIRAEYESLLLQNPDSPAFDSCRNTMKKAQKYSKETVDIRMGKICKMAVRAAMGGAVSLDQLTAEEKTYYETVFEASKFHRSLLDGNEDSNRPVLSFSTIVPPKKEEIQPEPESYVEEEIVPEDEPVEEPVPVKEQTYKSSMGGLFGTRTNPKPSLDDDLDQDEVASEVPPIEETQYTESVSDIPFEEPMEAVEEGIPPVDMGDDFEESEEQEIPDDELDRMIPPDLPVDKKSKPSTPFKISEEYSIVRVLEDTPDFATPDHNYSPKKEQIMMMSKTYAEPLRDIGKVVILDVEP